jgi:hypothetical protein
MSRTRKRYANGQKRTSEGMGQRRNPKDYHTMEIKFHGSESAYVKWAEKKAGY